MENFNKALKELEEMSRSTTLSTSSIQKQDERNRAKQIRNYIEETTEKIEGCVIICILKNNNCFLDSFAKKGTFNFFFAKFFKYVKLKH